MASVIFTFNGKEVTIQCNIKDSIEEICKKYCNKIDINYNKLIFIYGGQKIKSNLSFEEQANFVDKEKKQMNVLVYEIDNFNINEELQKEKSILIENLKTSISQILSLYLEDREYLENKVDNWRDAILKEISKLFIDFKDYKSFIHLYIYNKGIKESDYYKTWNTKSLKDTLDFDIDFSSQKIEASVNINMFAKNIKRTKKDLREVLNIAEKEFLNLAEGRTYKIFKEKYYQIFRRKLLDEILKDYKYSLFYFFNLSNKYHIYSSDSIIINKDIDDYFISKTINAGESKLYIIFGKAN